MRSFRIVPSRKSSPQLEEGTDSNCPLLLSNAPVFGHRAVTRHFRGWSGHLIHEAANVAGSRVPRGFCEWCREGELNPQDPKVGGF